MLAGRDISDEMLKSVGKYWCSFRNSWWFVNLLFWVSCGNHEIVDFIQALRHWADIYVDTHMLTCYLLTLSHGVYTCDELRLRPSRVAPACLRAMTLGVLWSVLFWFRMRHGGWLVCQRVLHMTHLIPTTFICDVVFRSFSLWLYWMSFEICDLIGWMLIHYTECDPKVR